MKNTKELEYTITDVSNLTGRRKYPVNPKYLRKNEKSRSNTGEVPANSQRTP